jgi:YesN/AraC family two-component response regulator
MNLLIADDSLLMRRQIRKIAEGLNITVVGEADNGLSAYELYKECKPDVVTMDITMPVLTGIASTKKIIDQFPDAKIIMLSALNQKKLVFTALQYGAKHYLIKPITPAKLQEAITKVFPDNLKEKSLDNAITLPAFTIENVNSTFHIHISSNFCEEDSLTLRTQISAFFIITPLITAVHLDSSIKDIFYTSTEKVLIKMVHDAGGKITINITK